MTQKVEVILKRTSVDSHETLIVELPESGVVKVTDGLHLRLLASSMPREAAAQLTPIARYCHHCDNWREGTHPHGEIEHNDH